MKKLILSILLLSQSTFAADGGWYNWVEPVNIKDIRVQGNRGIISFRTIEPHQNIKSTCNNDYYGIEMDVMGKEMLSILLAAKMANKPVGINIDATKCEPYSRILVTQIRVL
jgi:hypothetical protein